MVVSYNFWPNFFFLFFPCSVFVYNTKLENLSNTKLVVDNRSVFIPLKTKDEKVYVPPFKRNHKRKACFARLDKGKSSDIDTKVFKPVSKPTAKLQKKFVFVPTYHLCSVVGHIRPNCFLLRQEQKLVTRNYFRNTDIPKFVPVCHFCGVYGHIRPNYHKLKFKQSVFLGV